LNTHDAEETIAASFLS